MISAEERALCTRAVSNALRHLEARDVAALRRDLEEIRDVFVYSDYSFWKEWQHAKPRIIRLLFQESSWEEFLEIFEGRNFGRHEAWPALDEIAGKIPVSQFLILCEKWGLPSQYVAPQSVAKLASDTDNRITPWLLDWIETYIERERDTWLWSGALAGVLRILAERRDALEAVAAMLRERRFGAAYGSANRALVEGLSAQNSEDSRRLLLELAQDETQPGHFRLLLLAQIAHFVPHQALQSALADLEKVRETGLIEGYLVWLDSNSTHLKSAARQVTPQMDTAPWSAITKATQADIWARHYPFWPLHVSLTSRAILFVARRFGTIPALKFGGAIPFFSFLTGGAFYLWSLNHLVGPPPSWLRWHEHWPVTWSDVILLFMVWPLFALWQLSAEPWATMRQKWGSAVGVWASALTFFLITFLIRLWTKQGI